MQAGAHRRGRTYVVARGALPLNVRITMLVYSQHTWTRSNILHSRARAKWQSCARAKIMVSLRFIIEFS
jgi:hypothetical protein